MGLGICSLLSWLVVCALAVPVEPEDGRVSRREQNSVIMQREGSLIYLINHTAEQFNVSSEVLKVLVVHVSVISGLCLRK